MHTWLVSSMKKVYYNKLVADGLPGKLQALGSAYDIRVIEDDEEYEQELLKKLVEEANELRSAKSKDEVLKELADVLEIIDAIKTVKGLFDAEVTEVKAERLQKRGGFFKRLFMHWSEDDGYEAKKKA
jgi:predicted house-cleaning noncanonical NTP pyrophosphatase (MazG superfamily)